jgi:hypothetical protein
MPTHKEQMGELWPTGKHPSTGEPFKRCLSWEMNRDIYETYCFPPQKPGQEIWDYNTDPPQYVRKMTKAEYQKALREYRRELKEWNRTGGKMCVPGQPTTAGEFVTESGAWAEGIMGAPGEWSWRRWGISIGG